MEKLSLNGAWTLARTGVAQAIPANVPGCVHLDLLAEGLIPDPYFRDNELQVLWVGETDWTYRRTFAVDAAFLAHERVWLRCEGLDTIATLTLNGALVGCADNMFRTWEYDVRELLRAGENELVIAFRSPMQYVREKAVGQRFLPAWGVGDHKLDGGGWIRKEPCNFGWDWGPKLATCGIWRDIALLAYDRARLDDVHVMQQHAADVSVEVEVRVAAEQASAGELTARVELTFEGQAVDNARLVLADGRGVATLQVAEPQLWWPNGMGAQPLYKVRVTLHDAAGRALDERELRIGLRRLELVRQPDAWGESFHFSCNGVPFFAKGANWIPDDVFAARMTRERYRASLEDARQANMNMLRVWGGGIYEEDAFYDLCDEMGLCVWQDFIFACATYPTFDSAWMANVAVEAEQNVRRIRHHASLALWCGNNELEQGLVGDAWTETTMSWDDYGRLFDQLLPTIVARLDPQTDYWPCSPHSPLGPRQDFNNPTCGDAHLWSVWHGQEPFEWYRGCTHRFNSEFGFQSFPEPRTVYGYTEPQDRNITSWVMEHHQRSGIGNTTIMKYLCDWFRLPRSFEMNLWLTQILQGMAIKYAVEHWRRDMPRGMGTLYWQLNDCWPVASWSSVDSLGRWKALHYMARRFFAPLLISGLDDWDTGLVEVHVTSDRLAPCSGTASWLLTDVAGRRLDGGELAVEIAANGDILATTLDLSERLAQHGARQLLLWLALRVGGESVSTNLVTFARPKHLELQTPGIAYDVTANADGSFAVTLTAEKPALWAWLSLRYLEARYSDAFFHLLPGQPVTVTVTPLAPATLEEVRSQLEVSSLIDTY
jgi:beta-mannosidase